MPSLIFHEGNLDDKQNQATIKKTEQPLTTETSNVPEVFRVGSYAGYNPTARRLMWLTVILLTLVICVMWIWSMMGQFYSVKWSASPEKTFVDNLKNNWDKSFHTENGQSLSTDQLKNEVKENLAKLFFDAATSTTATTTATTTTTLTTTEKNTTTNY